MWKKLNKFIQDWAGIVGGAVGIVTSLAAFAALIGPWQPIATKSYVQTAIAEALKPVATQIAKTDATTLSLGGRVDDLTDATLSYQLIQLSTMATKLKQLIDSGTATNSDIQLYNSIEDEISKEQALKAGVR